MATMSRARLDELINGAPVAVTRDFAGESISKPCELGFLMLHHWRALSAQPLLEHI